MFFKSSNLFYNLLLNLKNIYYFTNFFFFSNTFNRNNFFVTQKITFLNQNIIYLLQSKKKKNYFRFYKFFNLFILWTSPSSLRINIKKKKLKPHFLNNEVSFFHFSRINLFSIKQYLFSYQMYLNFLIYNFLNFYYLCKFFSYNIFFLSSNLFQINNVKKKIIFKKKKIIFFNFKKFFYFFAAKIKIKKFVALNKNLNIKLKKFKRKKFKYLKKKFRWGFYNQFSFFNFEKLKKKRFFDVRFLKTVRFLLFQLFIPSQTLKRYKHCFKRLIKFKYYFKFLFLFLSLKNYVFLLNFFLFKVQNQIKLFTNKNFFLNFFMMPLFLVFAKKSIINLYGNLFIKKKISFSKYKNNFNILIQPKQSLWKKLYFSKLQLFIDRKKFNYYIKKLNHAEHKQQNLQKYLQIFPYKLRHRTVYWVYNFIKMKKLKKTFTKLIKPRVLTFTKIRFSKKDFKFYTYYVQSIQKFKRKKLRYRKSKELINNLFVNSLAGIKLFMKKKRTLRFFFHRQVMKRNPKLFILPFFFSMHKEINFLLRSTSLLHNLMLSSSIQKTPFFFSQKLPSFLIMFLFKNH